MSTENTVKKPNFFQRLVAKIESLWKKDVAPTVDVLVTDIKTDVEPELKTLLVTDISALATASYAAIKTAAASGTSPKGWFAVAYDAIEATLPALGKTLTSTTIGLLAVLFQGHAKAQAATDGTLVSDAATAEVDQPVATTAAAAAVTGTPAPATATAS